MLKDCRVLLLSVVCVFSGMSVVSADEPKASDGPAETPERAPDVFKVKFETTCGEFVVECHREWAPLGADRFHELVRKGFYDDSGFFRVVPGFVVQFGLHADPSVQEKWSDAKIKDEDEDVIESKSNTRGYITFATAGPNTRTSQLFINFGDNARLDKLGFVPFGKVVEGMDVVDKISSVHGQDPRQDLIKKGGTKYLKAEFPNLDYIRKAVILKPEN